MLVEDYKENITSQWEISKKEENDITEEEIQEWIDFQNMLKLYHLSGCGRSSTVNLTATNSENFERGIV